MVYTLKSNINYMQLSTERKASFHQLTLIRLEKLIHIYAKI